jgi:hypothetical protein
MLGTDEKCIQNFTRKPEEKSALETPRYRWKDNIKMYLQGIGYEGVDQIHVDQDKVQCGVFVKN